MNEPASAWPPELNDAPDRQQAIRAWWLAEQDTWAEVREWERREESARTPQLRSDHVRGLMQDRNYFDWLHACREAASAGRPHPPGPLRVRESEPPDPGPAVRAVQAWATACGIELVFVGGVAVGVLVRPRFTRDVDALAIIDDLALDAALDRLGEFGLAPRPGWTREFARRRGIVALYHDRGDMAVDVLIAPTPLHAEFVRSGVWVDAFSDRVRIAAVESLFIMKALAARRKDHLDMEHMLDFRGDEVDLQRVRGIVAAVAESAAMPTVLEEYDAFLRAHFGHPSRRHGRTSDDP